MKVVVEIELPVSCNNCPFHYSGTIYEWCNFDVHNGLLLQNENFYKSPEWCPLKKCKEVQSNDERR